MLDDPIHVEYHATWHIDALVLPCAECLGGAHDLRHLGCDILDPSKACKTIHLE